MLPNIVDERRPRAFKHRISGGYMNRTRVRLAAAAVAVASVGAASCTGSQPDARRASERASTQAAAPAVPIRAEDGEQVTAALLGRGANTKVFVDGITAADAQLPAGSGLTLNLASATITGDTARVPAVVTGALAGDWTVLLVRIDGAWRVYGTVRA